MSPRITQKIAFSLLFLVSLVVFIPVLFIIGILVSKGAAALTWEFIFSMPKDGMRGGGILPAIVGTLLIVLCSISIALPVGILAAVYLNEYAKDNLLTRIIQLSIVNLAGVPSIIYGLFGLAFFVIMLNLGVSVIAGALTLAIMELPSIITTTRNSLNNVPASFREVSLSLGVSRWQTIRRVVLPNALPGIMTGAILSIARIAGETAPILFTAAAFYVPHLPHSLSEQVMALPYHLYVISTQIPNMPEKITYGTALILVLLVLILSFTVIILRIFFRKRYKW
ncbi:MAG: phosphate ABC transporter permease PstA [Spirochaetales bacterium]|nr:phosphate ABC transporter permease PstA [Spirochaetales bacterium]